MWTWLRTSASRIRGLVLGRRLDDDFDQEVHAHVFSGIIAASQVFRALATVPGEAETVQGQLVSENYFSALGIRMAVGRSFAADENRTRGEHPVIVLGYPYWRLRFHADPQAPG